ncbi:metalloregulator ArsR/SmtB family transcription factor [Variovorax sp. ZS18.2.2]|uniref:ArsR/SmtB family transcription factor n=1 Tax=Variovorax sp. ZS18.2.2 TaxID=2971255 RepID=UPI00215149F0|nr:metalloregulator ArsR/SmtB family transcription factor [Variovorax sp. ZS18.2.2]MCR6478066.1 metalloregulator ArsR/SmtB family transcription factor [Variovorax sp. ZS18.2.2]
MNSENAVVALAALAQPSRLAIFRLLVVAGSGGMSVGKIGEELALPAATLSFHMKELTHAGLIQGTQEGKFVYYRAKFAQMNELLAFLVEHCCDGSGEDCEVELPQCVAEVVQRRRAPARKRVARA